MSFSGGIDELLVAYLDNELSVAERSELELRLSYDAYLIQRLAYFQRTSLPFKAAFEPLLAPVPQTALKPHRKSPTAPELTRRKLIAAAVGFLALGVIGDRVLLHFSPLEENWRETVAQYMALYTPETLADTPTASSLEAQLQNTGKTLAITLSAKNLALPDATLKNARVLAYDEQRIAQISWLDASNGPLALCITQNVGAASAPQSEQRLGMNIVYWATPGHRFMIIGHGSDKRMKQLAGQLQQGLPV